MENNTDLGVGSVHYKCLDLYFELLWRKCNQTAVYKKENITYIMSSMYGNVYVTVQTILRIFSKQFTLSKED